MFCPTCGTSLTAGSAFCPSCGSPVAFGANPSQPAQAAAPAPALAPPVYAPAVMDYATWGSRAIGFIIDSLLVGAAVLILYASLGEQGDISFLAFLVAALLISLYNRVYLVSTRGHSIGQGLVHVKVVDGSGRVLSQGTALVRFVAEFGMGLVPFLTLLDLLWPLWDQRRQTLHDKAVSCYVINNPQGA